MGSMKLAKLLPLSACVFALALVAGCTTYYRVTDQSTRRQYYTTDIERTDSGAVRFFDERSRAKVTLQSSEVVEISRGAYESGIKQ
jgi:hypothetical protein